MPAGAQPPEPERAIVVAAAHAETHAVTIEAEERQEHDIEQADARELRPFGLCDAEAVDAPPLADLREAHGAHSPPPVDARQIHEAPAAQRERDERRGVELLGSSGVDADAPAGAEIERVIGMARDLPGGTRALRGGYGPAPCPEGRPQRAAGVVHAGIRKRHPPVPVRTVALEPEQQVGRAVTGKAFRSWRTCTVLPTSPAPWVFQLGSEVTRPACRTPQATPGTTLHQRRPFWAWVRLTARVAGPARARSRPARAAPAPCRPPRSRPWRRGRASAAA